MLDIVGSVATLTGRSSRVGREAGPGPTCCQTRGVPPRLFVYGTLMPGHLRWGLLAPFVTDQRPATVAGQLYDTGLGWPAARFAAPLDLDPVPGGGPSDPGVPGWLLDVEPGATTSLLDRLDDVEGVASVDGALRAATGDYRRVRVRTTGGDETWAYEALTVAPRWTAISAWTDQLEN